MAKTIQEINNASRRKIYKFQQICLHREYDADVIEKLDSVASKPAYIKALIRADIAKNESLKKSRDKQQRSSSWQDRRLTTD